MDTIVADVLQRTRNSFLRTQCPGVPTIRCLNRDMPPCVYTEITDIGHSEKNHKLPCAEVRDILVDEMEEE